MDMKEEDESLEKKLNRPSQHFYLKDFAYQHNNPYHHRLESFEHFVRRDNEAETFQGKWNTDFFKTEQPIDVEVGTGYGHFMIDYTQKNDKRNFVGMDFRFKRSFNLAKKLNTLPHQNFCYLRARAERLEFLFGENEVDRIFYFFPDPWPKTRHKKKRLFQKPFLEAAAKVLKKDGILFVKTDHDEYFDWMINEFDKFESTKKLEKTYQTFDLHNDLQAPEELISCKTKFEKIFLKKEIKIKAMVLKCS